jgi:hypothetical protein
MASVPNEVQDYSAEIGGNRLVALKELKKKRKKRSARQFVQRAFCYREHGEQAYTYTPPV